jgi:DNA-binding NarL/FixJ family response regulator
VDQRLNSTRPKSVVLIDDSADMRTLLRMAFEQSAEFDLIAEAPDGEAGVEAVRRSQPDVVLLDIAMPVMDGLQALTLIREECPSAIVVVFSSFGAASGLPKRATSLGAHGFVRKGSTIAEVLAELSTIVGSSTLQ